MGRGRRKPGWERVRGCAGLYRLPGGGLFMRFQVKGERVCEKIPEHLSVEQAKGLVRSRRMETADAQLGFRHNEHLVERLVAAYFAYKARRLKPETLRGYRAASDRMLAWLSRQGVKRVSQLDVGLMEDYAALRGAEVGNRAVNLEIDSVRRMLDWGVRRWRRLKSNPLSDFERLPEGGRRRRAVSEPEYWALVGGHEHPVCGALGGESQPCRNAEVWLVLGETGLRPGELGRLAWEHVDLRRGSLYVVPGKTKASERTIWLSRPAWECLVRRAWRLGLRGHRAAGLVFSTRRGKPVTVGLCGKLRRCLSAAGIDGAGLTCHSLRHFYASRLLAEGIDPKVVQALLGHESSRMTMDVYGHEVAGGRRRAAAALERAWGRRPGGGFQ